jgi:MFS family permease
MAELFGVERLGTMLGALYTGGGFGAIIGPPIVGALIDRTGSYRIAIACTFAIGMASWAVLIPMERHLVK